MTTASFVGGLNVEVSGAWSTRFNIGMPLAKLAIADSHLVLSFITVFALLIPKSCRTVICEKSEVDHVFRSRGLGRWGVGVAMTTGRTHYFWTFRPGTVLQELQTHGYILGADQSPAFFGLIGRLRLHRH